MKNYQEQANDFLHKTNTSIVVEFMKSGPHFDGDKETRDIYNVTISRGSRSFKFTFGQSIYHSGAYVGHKHLCTKHYGKYIFTAKEAEKIPSYIKIQNEIKKNPNFSEPTNYDILACLQKYDVGSFEDFCSEFGYDEDSRKAEKTYNAVCKEYEAVDRLFGDIIEQLQEIQ